MDTINLKSLLNIIAFLLFVFITQFAFASMNDEDTINKIFETHGKENVVGFISQRRGGKITIQKNKSFLNTTRRPDLTLITAKSIIQDLKILKIDISNLKPELDIHIENESKNQQEESERLNDSASINGYQDAPLSKDLQQQINAIRSKYNKTDSVSERERLKKELSRLKAAYRKARNNEKSKLKVYFPDEKSKRRNSDSCKRIKSKLQKMTEPNYRHQAFFCNERDYRTKNPKLCDQSRYARRYTQKEHKDEIRKLRLQASKNCGS